MRKFMLLFILALAPLHAQTTTPPTVPQPLEAAWNVSVNGNFTSLQNQPTNNGILISVALRMSNHWNIRADTYLMQTPNITVALGGPEYRFSLAHLFAGQMGPINSANTEVFLNAGIGDAHATAIISQSGNSITTQTTRKFAASVGGGFDIQLSPTVTIRPLDIKYIRSSMITNGGTLLGNHLDFSAGLGLHF